MFVSEYILFGCCLKPDLFQTGTSLEKDRTEWNIYDVKMTSFTVEQPQSGDVTVITVKGAVTVYCDSETERH